MLQLKNIVKTYLTGDLRQDALRGVSIAFRESEFVSILGQSGSGKTTMLNIIGGLDRYTSGDLVIGGISTKEYKDADWDYYRNNSIGFVFQSYNLIPHQCVLSNVEMALTLAGVSKRERRQRAIAVLKKVGLGEHMHKRPNQMSGGQMQRVAIARALVNNPDILLADEPTGALDSETSVQIMELLKEIAKDKLVIMVTHNPELAERYSTRIVKLLDGKIVSDTNPCQMDERTSEKRKHKKISMSFLTALSLSFNNLRTKKGRTLLTSFAGSIGIIGIALILALSTGMNRYIADVQKQTMSAYPISISAEAVDVSSLMGIRAEIIGEARGDTQEDTVQRTGVYADYTAIESSEKITSSIVENNLSAFKKYLDDPESEIHRYLGENGIIYSYDVRFSAYSYDPDGQLVNSDRDVEVTSPVVGNNGKIGLMNQIGSSAALTGASSGAENFSELTEGAEGATVSQMVTDSYDVLYGRWPEEYDEVVLVLNEKNGISLNALYQLGLISGEEYDSALRLIESGREPEELCLDYPAVCQHLFYLLTASDHYIENENGTFSLLDDQSLTEEWITDKGIELKITGITRPREDAANATISTPVAYTAQLTRYIIDRGNSSPVILAQEADPQVNVLTGMQFQSPDEVSMAEDARAYLSALGISEKAAFYKLMMYYASGSGAMPMDGEMDEISMAAALDMWLGNDPDQEILLKVYDEYIAGASYADNMTSFGKVSYDAPASVSIYVDSFESKDSVADCIAAYNETAGEDGHITYTDYVAMLTSSITTIIDGISYVLVAFVAISLVVSCIMIGIITHISVMERTKEIGILRALGASKRNISQVFNAETFIIGCCAGVLGIGVSVVALVPINSVIVKFSGLLDLRAQLPLNASFILILISIVITVIGGLLPARNAAKKDPVIALRTE